MSAYEQETLFGWNPIDKDYLSKDNFQLDLLKTDSQQVSMDDDIHELDQLFLRSTEYKLSTNYLELLDFINQQRTYAPYNAFLMHTQHPEMTHAENATDWKNKYDRDVRPGARPLVILIPFGPVNFVYDIEDTVGPPLPEDLTNPFRASGKLPPKAYDYLQVNCSRLEVAFKEENLSNSLAGNIRSTGSGYLVQINQNHIKEVQFATIVHEIAHLLCGHIGARPKTDKWQDRREINHQLQEIEAESVSYLVCKRLGIASEAEAYLSSYISKHTTIGDISLHHVLTVSGRILSMCEKIVVKKKD